MSFESKRARSSDYNSLQHKIPAWIPVWYGLRIASLEVLGEDMPMPKDAQSVIALVDGRLTAAVDTIRKEAPPSVNVEELPCIKSLKECGR
jgi:hypothetical protein